MTVSLARWTEAERLAALHRTGLLDTAPEQAFDDLVRLAAELLGTPMAGLHLVAETRQFGKAEIGLGVREMPRDIAFCPHAMVEGDALVIPDATQDPRFAKNPLVTGQPGIRFYAGAPLVSEGLPIGALCVIDSLPRPEGLSEREHFILKTLASYASSQIALRQAVAERDRVVATQARSDALRRQTLDGATDYAILSTDNAGRITGWNAGAESIFGWDEAEMLGQGMDQIFTPEDLGTDRAGTEMDQAIGHGSADSERWYRRKDGSRFWATGQMRPLRDSASATIGFVKVLQDRTEQHRTAVQLAHSEERYRALFESIDAGFCIIEMKFDDTGKAIDYRFVESNPAFERQTGLVNAIGRWMRDLAPAHEQHWFDLYGAVARTGQPVRFENPAEALGRWYDVHAFRIGDPAQNLVAVLFNDISERRRFEATLRQSEAQWRGLFEQLQEGFILGELIRDAAGHVTDWCYRAVNPAWSNMFGIPAAIATGQTVRALFPGIENEWIDQMAEAVASGQPTHFARQVGALSRWFEGRVHKMDGDRFAVLFQDITARRQGEAQQAALLELGDRLRDNDDPTQMSFIASEIICRTLGASRTGYAAVNGDSVVIPRDWCAPGMESVVGEHRMGDYGGFFANLQRGETVAITDVREDSRTSDHADALEKFAVRSLLNLPLVEQGRMVALLFVHSAVPRAWSAEEIGFTHSVADRTQAAIARRRAEAELRDLNASLETMVQARTAELARTQAALVQSQKMEAVGQLTGGLAHDFNNLLTGITGSLELLQTRVAQQQYGSVGRYVSAAQLAARRAAALTHRLLAFSRRQTLDPKPVNLNRMVADMEELVRRTVGPEITVQIDAQADLWTTHADQSQVENALLNLCINARDAMPGGGSIIVRTRNQHLGAADADERDLPVGDFVQLCVQDSGTGMTPEVIARAFDPFFTTKPIGQGTGLGLSMIYGFARQSGGQVHIRSKPGEGSTVSILLPRQDGDVPAAATRDPDLAQAPRAKTGDTVLVVDDDPTVRMLVIEVLQELGYDTLEAADGAGGLRVLQSGAEVDLLITDVGLPGGMNGRQMADAARIARRDLKVLFITGYAESAVLGDGQLDPGMHVMTKPFALENLAKRISAIIEDR